MTSFRTLRRALPAVFFAVLVTLSFPSSTFAQEQSRGGGEANLVLPDLSLGDFLGVSGRDLLMGVLVVCALGLLFGLLAYKNLRDLPVHQSMREVSELIWETCKTYLFQQGKWMKQNLFAVRLI